MNKMSRKTRQKKGEKQKLFSFLHFFFFQSDQKKNEKKVRNEMRKYVYSKLRLIILCIALAASK